MRRLQIGIIGSCSDMDYSDKAEVFVKELGELIAKAGHSLMFGAEKDFDSLPTTAALAARKAGGETIAITYEKGLDIFVQDSATVVIASGLVRGAARETALVLSCDVVISISGGSGTLSEMSIAYMSNIPVVAVTGFGGWSEKLAGTYLDERKRFKFIQTETPQDAFDAAIFASK